MRKYLKTLFRFKTNISISPDSQQGSPAPSQASNIRSMANGGSNHCFNQTQHDETDYLWYLGL